MQENIHNIVAAIPSKKLSPIFYLWTKIQEKIKKIDASEDLTRLAFIIIFLNFKKYNYDLQKLSLNPHYANSLATLLLALFESLRQCSEEKKIIYPQTTIYCMNFSYLLENLSWATMLCEKLANLDSKFLVELLKIEPFNKKLAEAIPNVFLLTILENYTASIKNFNDLEENFINFFREQDKKNTSCTKNGISFFSLSIEDKTSDDSLADPLDLSLQNKIKIPQLDF